MEQMPPPTPTTPRLRVSTLLLSLALVCVLGTLALLPFDLPVFMPGAPSSLDTFTVWYGPHGLMLSSWSVLLAELLCILLVIAATSLDRRLDSRVRVRAVLLVSALLLMLGVILNSQKLLRVVLLAGFNHGLGGIPIPFDVLPFFFVALAATFLVGRLVQHYGRWRQGFFFALTGFVCANMGLLLHVLALSLLASQQASTGPLIYDLLLLLPLALLLGVIGGLLGGALRLGLTRYFSASGEARRASREIAPVSSGARIWAIAWRLIVAGSVGALPAGEGSVALWFSLNRQATPLILFTPATFNIIWMTAFIPVLLIAGGLLLGQEARQNGSAPARIGAGLLVAVLILGAADLLLTLYITSSTLRRPTPSTTVFLLSFAASSLWAVLPRALLAALALGSGPLQGRRARRALPVLLGVAVFLGSVPGVVHNLQVFLEPFDVSHSPTVRAAFLLAYGLVGLVAAGVCGVLGAWLRGKVLATAVQMSRQPPATIAEAAWPAKR